MPELCLIAAVARNRVIGGDNRLLWHLRTDLRRFRDLTVGKPLIMGRRTFESIGKPLPNRTTIVVTRNPAFSVPGVLTARSLDEALERARACCCESAPAGRGAAQIMIGGGGEIYALALPLADRLYLTLVDLAPAGDVFFPDIAPTQWREVHREPHQAGTGDDAAFVFVEYERRAVPATG